MQAHVKTATGLVPMSLHVKTATGIVALSGGASAPIDADGPVFTSGATATPIAENSGAGQVVYTAAATDASLPITYSIKPVGDYAAFSINGSTGAVTLTANPDYETQASYSFTVIATDAAGNASEQAVSLAITDADENVYPLDVAGALPAYAYGTIKLTAGYSGPAVRVLRPSDSAEQDIGFSGADLDLAALSAFLSNEVGRVTVMYDQSGNGNHGTQTNAVYRPYINPAVKRGSMVPVSFVGQYMNIPSAVTLQRTALTHVELTESSSSYIMGAHVQYGSGSDQVSLFEQVGGLQSTPGFVPTSWKVHISPSVLIMKMSATGVSASYTDDLVTSAYASNVAMSGGFIGNTGLTASYTGKFAGYMFAGYPRVISNVESAAIQAAVESRDHVPQANTNRIIFSGDSICAHVSYQDKDQFFGYAKKCIDLLSSDCNVYNFALGGSALHTNGFTLYTNALSPLLSMYPANNHIIFLAHGTNDLTILGRSASEIYSDIQTYCSTARADGAKIILATLLPNGSWDVTRQATRNDLNALIRGNWSTFADGIADFAADPTMGPQSAASNLALYPDGLHVSMEGAAYLAPIAAAAINALLP